MRQKGELIVAFSNYEMRKISKYKSIYQRNYFEKEETSASIILLR